MTVASHSRTYNIKYSFDLLFVNVSSVIVFNIVAGSRTLQLVTPERVCECARVRVCACACGSRHGAAEIHQGSVTLLNEIITVARCVYV